LTRRGLDIVRAASAMRAPLEAAKPILIASAVIAGASLLQSVVCNSPLKTLRR
jgi:hypothetical protein